MLQGNQNNNQLSSRQNTIPLKTSLEPDKNHHMLNTFIEQGGLNKSDIELPCTEATDTDIENLLTKKTHFQNQTLVSRKWSFKRTCKLK